MKFGCLCSVLMAEVVGATIYAASPWLIGAFSREADVIAFGVRQAHTITLFYCLLAFSHCCAGILRGLLRDGYPVTPGFKVADVDPRREELENCFLISDKARCIAGSVLELIAENLWK